MSTVTSSGKRKLADALYDAEDFRMLFNDLFERWEIAGSIRRKKPEVGDVEHVVIPKFGQPGATTATGLFGSADGADVNLVFDKLDAIVRGPAAIVVKHVYGATGHRWGNKYRGVDFRGFNHEIFVADENNWGPALAIRTGPAEFSQKLVTRIRDHGHRNIDGYVWRCERCACATRGKPNKDCLACAGTGLSAVEKISVGDERAYLELCGVGWIEPEKRS